MRQEWLNKLKEMDKKVDNSAKAKPSDEILSPNRSTTSVLPTKTPPRPLPRAPSVQMDQSTVSRGSFDDSVEAKILQQLHELQQDDGSCILDTLSSQ
jgi:hypothetical protein